MSLAATWDGLEERSIHLKVMIHRIHTGGRAGAASLDGIAPHVIYGYGGNALFFDEGLFPNDLRNCTVCHVGKTYVVEAVPGNAPPTIANETATVRHAASSALHASGEASTPADPGGVPRLPRDRRDARPRRGEDRRRRGDVRERAT